jgi:hypothetical protein
MSDDTPGGRLKVFTAGLGQLAVRCQSLGATLCAESASSLVAASLWQANAGAVNIACGGTRKGLEAAGFRGLAS